MVRRTCKGVRNDGSACGAAPMRESELCLMHDPEHAEAVAEGRRLGGTNRKREVLLTTVHDFEGLGSIGSIMRLLEIAVADCLGVERGLTRARTLSYLAQQATKLLQVGEFEERLGAIESVLGERLPVNEKGNRR